MYMHIFVPIHRFFFLLWIRLILNIIIKIIVLMVRNNYRDNLTELISIIVLNQLY